jgi:hypothetical protein
LCNFRPELSNNWLLKNLPNAPSTGKIFTILFFQPFSSLELILYL